MKVFRLSKQIYASELSGVGAAKFGNRWNSKGVEVIYVAQSRALAMAEVAVHLTLATLPSDFMMIEIEVPKSVSILTFDEKKLSDNWNAFPHNRETQVIGDNFIQSNTHCLLKVPSAVVKGDYNYLINPYHKEMKLIKITSVYDFPFDKRIFQ